MKNELFIVEILFNEEGQIYTTIKGNWIYPDKMVALNYHSVCLPIWAKSKNHAESLAQEWLKTNKPNMEAIKYITNASIHG